MREQVNRFAGNFLHYIVSRTGDKVPRPLAHALHGTKPDEMLYMDLLYIGDSTQGLKYFLVLCDALSSYAWLYPTADATTASAAAGMSMWVGTFGSMD